MFPTSDLAVDGFGVRRMVPGDEPLLQDLFVRCVDHFELHDGEPPGPHAADIEFGDVPPGRTIDHKHLHAIVDPREPGRLVAVVESVNGYPDETTWFLGLLLVDPAHRGRGLGTAVLLAFEAMVAAAGYARARLAVIEPNVAGRRFWERHGYRLEAVRDDRPFGRLVHRVQVMVHDLPEVPGAPNASGV